VALPRLLDSERGLRLLRESGAEPTQFSGAPQCPVDEEAVQHRVEADCQIDVAADEIIRPPTAEPVAAAFAMEPQQMVAVKLGFTDPELADHTAIDQGVVHRHSPHWLSQRALQPGGTGRPDPPTEPAGR